jgi:hypothetical protein
MKEWVATHNGCQIRVAKAWFGVAQLYKLYIDGDWRDTNVGMVSSHSPALSVRVTPAKLQPFLVEVYVKVRATVKAKICVDGKQVGGDTF